MAEKPRLKLPAEAKKGEVIEIKTLLPHVMESGQRKDKDGNAIPRKIITVRLRVQWQAGVFGES
jgi:sulfur-oxidizing protein SoxZ